MAKIYLLVVITVIFSLPVPIYAEPVTHPIISLDEMNRRDEARYQQEQQDRRYTKKTQAAASNEPSQPSPGGKISYSGIPCLWRCEHSGSGDKFSIGPDDPVAARQDRSLQRRIVNYGFLPSKTSGTACFVERSDGRVLLLDPLVTQGRQ
jgi:hypothetical protein